MEIWKDIKGYDGMYQISNFGKVRALAYTVKTYRGFRVKQGHYLKPTDNGKGYKIVGLSKNGKRKNYYIHRLVAEAFLENPNELPVINHKDFDTKNNNVENLEWVTQLENVRYSLPNKPKITKRTKPYGKYIKFDKRYGSYVVVVPDNNGNRLYKGSFKNLEQAIITRNLYTEI